MNLFSLLWFVVDKIWLNYGYIFHLSTQFLQIQIAIPHTMSKWNTLKYHIWMQLSIYLFLVGENGSIFLEEVNGRLAELVMHANRN